MRGPSFKLFLWLLGTACCCVLNACEKGTPGTVADQDQITLMGIGPPTQISGQPVYFSADEDCTEGCVGYFGSSRTEVFGFHNIMRTTTVNGVATDEAVEVPVFLVPTIDNCPESARTNGGCNVEAYIEKEAKTSNRVAFTILDPPQEVSPGAAAQEASPPVAGGQVLPPVQADQNQGSTTGTGTAQTEPPVAQEEEIVWDDAHRQSDGPSEPLEPLYPPDPGPTDVDITARNFRTVWTGGNTLKGIELVPSSSSVRFKFKYYAGGSDSYYRKPNSITVWIRVQYPSSYYAYPRPPEGVPDVEQIWGSHYRRDWFKLRLEGCDERGTCWALPGSPVSWYLTPLGDEVCPVGTSLCYRSFYMVYHFSTDDRFSNRDFDVGESVLYKIDIEESGIFSGIEGLGHPGSAIGVSPIVCSGDSGAPGADSLSCPSHHPYCAGFCNAIRGGPYLSIDTPQQILDASVNR